MADPSDTSNRLSRCHADHHDDRGNTVAEPAESRIRCNSRGLRHYTSRAGDPHRHLHLQINARVFAAGAVAGAPFGRGPRQHRGDQRDRARRRRRPTRSSGRRWPARVHPRRRDRRDRASSRRTPGRSAPGPRRSAATSTATRPRGARASRRGARAGAAARRGTGGRGPMPGPTRSSRRDGASSSRAGSRSCTSSATSTRTKPAAAGGARGRVDRPRRRGRAGRLVRLGAKRSAWNAADIRGEVESAHRPDRPRRRPGRARSSSPRTSPPAPSPVRPAARPRPTCPSTSGRSPRGRCWPSRPTSSTPARARRAAGPARPACSGRGAGPDRSRRRPPSSAPLAGDGPLVVVEGAAGAGKTTTLARRRTCSPSRAIGWWW